MRNWYEEGQKRVERVGRRYGILGFSKETAEERESKSKGDRGTSAVESSAAGKVTDAIAAYVLVKVSRGPSIKNLVDSIRLYYLFV